MWPFSKPDSQQQAAFDQKLSECAEKWKAVHNELRQIVFNHAPGDKPLDRDVFKRRKSFLEDCQKLGCNQNELLDLIEACPAGEGQAALNKGCTLYFVIYFVLLVFVDLFIPIGPAFALVTLSAILVLFIYITIYPIKKNHHLKRVGKPAIGTVIRYDNKQTNGRVWYYPIIEFATLEGQHIYIKGGTKSTTKPSEIGKTTEVCYDPQNPHDAIIKGHSGSGGCTTIIMFSFTLLFMLVVLLLLFMFPSFMEMERIWIWPNASS